jgi:tetratricopeptide (TPR) repeat protein
MVILACLFLAGSTYSHGGTFMDLEPGTAKKSDADRVLGGSGREIIGADRYEYKPEDPDIDRVSIKVNRGTGVIEQIDIHPGTGKMYYKSHYKKWFDLGEPSKTGFDYYPGDPKLHKALVEYYVKEGIALHYRDDHEGSSVAYFSHFDPKILDGTIDNKIPPLKQQRDEAYYLKKAEEAREKKDWEPMGSIVDEGLRAYPNSPQLWSERSSYFFHTGSVPREVKFEETLRSARRAYELDPKTLHALNLGWIYLEMFKDYSMAVSYFAEVESEYGPKNPDLYYWMAKCYEETGNSGRARDYYRRFLDAAPGSEKTRDARERLNWLR